MGAHHQQQDRRQQAAGQSSDHQGPIAEPEEGESHGGRGHQEILGGFDLGQGPEPVVLGQERPGDYLKTGQQKRAAQDDYHQDQLRGIEKGRHRTGEGQRQRGAGGGKEH